MITLGINAAYHDCAACIVRDGEVLAAAEEERFTHVKHGKRPVPFTVIPTGNPIAKLSARSVVWPPARVTSGRTKPLKKTG